jgi:hypothetical protein
LDNEKKSLKLPDSSEGIFLNIIKPLALQMGLDGEKIRKGSS